MSKIIETSRPAAGSAEEKMRAYIERDGRKWRQHKALFRIARHCSLTAGAQKLRDECPEFGGLSRRDAKVALANAKKLWQEHGKLLQNVIDNGINGTATCLPSGLYRQGACIAFWGLVGAWDTSFNLVYVEGTETFA